MTEHPPPRDMGLVVLKWLVVTLTATMIVGIVALVALLWQRLPPPSPLWPDDLALPDGVRAAALTRSRDWIAVVTEGGELLIFDVTGRELRRRIAID